ncbi:ABC transporter ATP-binding protein [Neorhodopirellula lusitana]|uniref:ABC transporter ATP-binding protein n=1 Tax=Neorhodopirellula lusitana TaxID=445327 RepID=UPI00384DA4AD
MPDSVSIHCREATVRFDDSINAVSKVTFQIQPGRRFALVGQSGCGKTTLLRVIAGLQDLTSGTLDAIAHGSEGRSTSRPRVSFVFQQPALLPWRRSLTNVTLPLELAPHHSGAKPLPVVRDELARQALDEVEMSNAANRFPFQLSGGMKMRVSIARALVTQPELLLLDEPFAALDDLLRTQLGDLVTALWRKHCFTMVLVTHNIAEAILLSDQIGVMHQGRLVSVLDNPLNHNAAASNPATQSDASSANAGGEFDMRRTPEFGEFFGVVSDELRKAAST